MMGKSNKIKQKIGLVQRWGIMLVYFNEKFRRGVMIVYSGRVIMVKMKDLGIVIVFVSKWLVVFI